MISKSPTHLMNVIFDVNLINIVKQIIQALFLKKKKSRLGIVASSVLNITLLLKSAKFKKKPPKLGV